MKGDGPSRNVPDAVVNGEVSGLDLIGKLFHDGIDDVHPSLTWISRLSAAATNMIGGKPSKKLLYLVGPGPDVSSSPGSDGLRCLIAQTSLWEDA